MNIGEMLSDNINVIVLEILFGSIDFGILFPILRAGMYRGNSEVLLFINPLLWLLFSIFLIAPIIAHLKNAGSL
jgi:hypothetical protein